MTETKFNCAIQDCPVKHCLKENCPIKKKIEQLETENILLKQELSELRAKIFGRKNKKEDTNESKKAPKPRKRGAPVGHPGWYRAKPEKTDKIVEVELTECPFCASKKISECKEIEEHTAH